MMIMQKQKHLVAESLIPLVSFPLTNAQLTPPSNFEPSVYDTGCPVKYPICFKAFALNISGRAQLPPGARAKQATPVRSSVFVFYPWNQTSVVKFGADAFVSFIIVLHLSYCELFVSLEINQIHLSHKRHVRRIKTASVNGRSLV